MAPELAPPKRFSLVCELLLLRLVGLAISVADDLLHHHRLSDRPDGLPKSSAAARRRTLLIISLCINFGFLGFFKYCNFFVDSFATMLTHHGRAQHTDVLTENHLASGNLVLHIPGSCLCRGCLQRRTPAVQVFRGLWAVHNPLPSSDRRPHPASIPPASPGTKARTFQERAFFDGCMLIVSGLFRKMRDSRQLCQPGQPCLRRTPGRKFLCDLDRCLRLRLANLW